MPVTMAVVEPLFPRDFWIHFFPGVMQLSFWSSFDSPRPWSLIGLDLWGKTFDSGVS